MADWMGQLPEEMRKRPLATLCIPGSHDSGAHWFNLKMDYAHDQDPLKYIRHFRCGFVKRMVERWAITQGLSIEEQLLNGVRFLDIRLEFAIDPNGISPKIQDDDDEEKRCFIVHGLYGADWLDVVEEICKFLEAHPTEVVIVNINHVYSLSELDYRRFVVHSIAHLACKYDVNLAETWVDLRFVSLERLLEKNFRIVLVGPFDFDVTTRSFRSSSIQNPWPMVNNVPDLLTFMQTQIHTPITPGIRVLQGVLTPKLSDIIFNIRKSLRSVFSLPCRTAVKNWIGEMEEEEIERLNVIMTDQVDAEFCRLVYSMNFREIPPERRRPSVARAVYPTPPDIVTFRTVNQTSSHSDDEPEIYIEEITEDIEGSSSSGPPKPPRMVMMNVVEMVLPHEMDEPSTPPSPVPPPKPKRFSMRIPIMMQVEEIFDEEKPVSPPPFPLYRVAGQPVKIASPVTDEEIRLARLGMLPSYNTMMKKKLAEQIKEEEVEMEELTTKKEKKAEKEPPEEEHSSDESSALLPQNIDHMVEDLVIHSTLDAMDNLAARFKALVSPPAKETWI